MGRKVLLSPDAVRQFWKLKAKERALLRQAMRKHLAEEDATETKRNRFRLRRASSQADYELRVEHLRVFYRIVEDEVLVALLGHKRGDQVIVEGKVFAL